MGFAKDLERGEAVERDLLERLKLVFPQARKAEGYHPEWDIEIPELKKTVEVKYDPMSQKTGNIVVEYYHNKPSAFSVSVADYWVIVTGKGEYWFSREGILSCILLEGMEPVCFTGTTDRHPKWVFLIPLSLLIQYSNGGRQAQL
jgi:hypothetical protein